VADSSCAHWRICNKGFGVIVVMLVLVLVLAHYLLIKDAASRVLLIQRHWSVGMSSAIGCLLEEHPPLYAQVLAG
jgi:hypothetical protein